MSLPAIADSFESYEITCRACGHWEESSHLAHVCMFCAYDRHDGNVADVIAFHTRDIARGIAERWAWNRVNTRVIGGYTGTVAS